MSDAPRPRPGPTPPDPGQPLNYVVDRRKVVLGVGFGILSAASVRHLDTAKTVLTVREVTDTTTDVASASQSSGADSSPESFAEAPVTSDPFDPPVLEASLRLAPGESADVVLVGGRVIDPESGFDRIANVALRGSTIVEISDQPIPATREIAAAGLVVSPGFIDILSYQPNGYGEWWKVADGVTTNLGMHGLRFDATEFHSTWQQRGVPVNFGGAVHNSHVRSQQGFLPSDTADPASVGQIGAAVEAQVRAGYLGVHVQPEYAPGVSATELADMGRIAASLGVPLCVHARFSDNQAPGVQADAMREVIEVADSTGCHLHIEHLNSTGGTGRMAEALSEVQTAIDGGLRITTCMYPYEFWATYLQSSRFNDWQDKFGLTFGDLQVAGTDQRLTADTYQQAYDQNELTAAFAIPSADLDLGVQAPFMMIGSDAILETSHNNHPRSTGAFARTIARYSRTRGLVSLVDALAMMTIRPAKLTEMASSQMARKGRMQIGADADVTVFDPLTIADRSTIADPAQESAGVEYVFVNGTEVRNPDGNISTALPGVAITSDVT